LSNGAAKEPAMPQAEPLPEHPGNAQGFAPAKPQRDRQVAQARVQYPVSDGKPMSESGIHWRTTVDAGAVLVVHHGDRPDVHVGGNLFMYYEEGNPKAVVSPDVFVAHGVSKEPPRDVWKVWEEGKAADFILEVTSKSTRGHDEGDKKRLYERLEVGEYWQFDPTGDYLDPVLKGQRMGADGRYRELRLEKRDGGLCRFSEVLGLDLRLEDGRLRFFDPERGEYLLTPEEQASALRAATAERDAVEAEWRREADALRTAEARITELERRLRSG